MHLLCSCQQDEMLTTNLQGRNDISVGNIVTLKSGIKVRKNGDKYIFGRDMYLSPNS